jgi:hypothetical protein
MIPASPSYSTPKFPSPDLKHYQSDRDVVIVAMCSRSLMERLRLLPLHTNSDNALERIPWLTLTL